MIGKPGLGRTFDDTSFFGESNIKLKKIAQMDMFQSYSILWALSSFSFPGTCLHFSSRLFGGGPKFLTHTCV